MTDGDSRQDGRRPAVSVPEYYLRAMSAPPYLVDPSRCMVPGCHRGNELMLHLVEEPWGGGDFCLVHAEEIAAATPLIATCVCFYCERARTVLP